MSARERTVDASLSGQTVAAGVRALLDVPWSRAKDLCKSGRVWVDGAPALDPAVRLASGARLRVDPEAARRRPGVLDEARLLHLDADVAVVEKAAGLLTVPYDEGDRDTLSDQLRALLRRRGGRARRRDPMVGVVQRLDKETTGVLVFARTLPAKRALQEQLRARSVGRRYLALVHGAGLGERRYESWIVQDRGDGLRGSWGTRPGHRGSRPRSAKWAATRVETLETYRDASKVACRLETGRQHQIRIHLSEAGHPLVGERVYVRDHPGPRLAAPRAMLHALELAFDHPRSGDRLTFRAPVPDDFRETEARLRQAGPGPT